MEHIARVAGAALGVVALAAVACRDAGPAGPSAPPATIAVTRGDGQRAPIGTVVATSPAVTVRDSAGAPVAGALVLFRVVAGGGALDDSVAHTDAGGVATAGRWTLGTRAGPQRLVAGVGGVGQVVNVEAIADPGPTAVIRVVGPQPVRGVAGGEVFELPVLHPEDQYGNPTLGGRYGSSAPAVSVDAPLGDSIAVRVDSTDVRLRWRLSATPGARTATVHVGDATLALAGATYATPYRFVVTNGSGRTARVLDTLRDVFAQLTDASGVPMSRVPVRVQPVLGGGTVTPQLAATDRVEEAGFADTTGVDGFVRVAIWQLGPETGPQAVRFTAPGASVDAVATATGTAVPLAARTIDAGGFETCALSTRQETYCWGRIDFTAFPLPLRKATPPFVALAGASRTDCGLTAAGTPYCWGTGFSPLLDALGEPYDEPVAIDGLPPLRRIAVGYGGACGLSDAGAAWCWGSSGGTSVTGPLVPPGSVPVFRDVMRSRDGSYTCGLPADGHPACWGTLPDTGRFTSSPYALPRTRVATTPLALPGNVALATFAPGSPLCGVTTDG
ncbi:MAG: hypothetical protein JO180_10920, partial [Gemmatirosa sp.]|nr:hypothetical protein [Gemmatirosa sp.]